MVQSYVSHAEKLTYCLQAHSCFLLLTLIVSSLINPSLCS
jgi:hypothetical protein